MEVTFVKATGPGARDRVHMKVDGTVRRAPVHVVHDLPHLVVESLFGIDDGLWSELAAGRHAGAAEAVTARDPKRNKHGRIVSGAADGTPTSRWGESGLLGAERHGPSSRTWRGRRRRRCGTARCQ